MAAVVELRRGAVAKSVVVKRRIFDSMIVNLKRNGGEEFLNVGEYGNGFGWLRQQHLRGFLLRPFQVRMRGSVFAMSPRGS